MKSFLSDRPRVAIPTLVHPHPAGVSTFDSALRGAKSLAGGSPAGQGGGGGNASQIECVRQGDKVSRLIVTCGCGERIEIDCLYAGT
jgi:hypothetical protein